MTEHERVQYWWKRALDAEAKLKPLIIKDDKTASELPVGTVVRDNMRLVQEKFSDGRWHVTGHSAAFEGHESYPVTVLYLPGVSEDLATGVDD